ncbi:MAG: S8/S53 family peptidase [Anaerolineales bacterium]|nr:S8/S53 family peptidase [Anaerolineales bacterium]
MDDTGQYPPGRPAPNALHQYFQPRQVTLHLEHRGHLDPRQIAILLQRLNRRLKGARLLPRRLGDRPALTFVSKQRTNFTFVLVEAAGIGDDPDALVDLLIQLQEDIIGDGLGQQALTLRTAAPNWLAGGAPAQIGTGGPGARPVKAASPANCGRFERKLGRGGGSRFGDGKSVDVAILDTAPALHDLVRTYYEWHSCHPGQHPLLESMLAPGGPLHLHPANAATLHRLADYELSEHQYLMSDHGLFAAGIIHSVVPQATLHLYEVLNPYGVGDLESIAAGLWQALQQPRSGKLVVNCSLVFSVPLEGHRDAGCLDRVRQHSGLLERWSAPIEALCLWLKGYDVPLVAAAGNDAVRNNGNPSGNRPSARYPAAFDSVIGVGALPRGSGGPGGVVAASYSNLADRPQKTGYATLGGEAGEANGILGLYIGPFPDGRPNDTKWAWWAGTSFAAPIITGLVAGMLSAGGSSRLADVQAGLSGASLQVTTDQEQVLDIAQP